MVEEVCVSCKIVSISQLAQAILVEFLRKICVVELLSILKWAIFVTWFFEIALLGDPGPLHGLINAIMYFCFHGCQSTIKQQWDSFRCC